MYVLILVSTLNMFFNCLLIIIFYGYQLTYNFMWFEQKSVVIIFSD